MNWEAGATVASSNPMGALELGWPFGLGPSESRRLGCLCPTCSVTGCGWGCWWFNASHKAGQFIGSLKLSPPQPALPAAGGVRMGCHGLYCWGLALSIWRLWGERLAEGMLSPRALSSSKLRGGAKPATEGPPDDKVCEPERDSGPACLL